MRIFFIRTAAVIAAAGLILAGCNNPAGDDGYNDPKTLVITGLPADWGTTASAALWNGSDDTLIAGGTASAVSGGQAEIPLQNISSGGDLYGQWTGSGDYYIKLWKSPWSSSLVDPDYITRAKVSFTSGSTTAGYAGFITWDEYESQDRGEKIGQISGTITLTGIPDPKPQVTVSASSPYWSTSSSAIDLSGVTGTSAENLAWTIPVYANDVDPGSWNAVTGTQTVTFLLSVDLKGDGNTFPIWLESSLDMTNKTGISAGSLGTASLASVNLSGTITARDGENPIPLVSISATDAEGRWIGDMYLYSPSANAPWSINIPIQQGGAVTFYVSVYDSSDAGNLILYKTFAPDAAKAVSNQPISGIVLDIGDISEGRINGTVTFSDVPTPAPYWIYVSADYSTDTNGSEYIWYIGNGTVALDGAKGTFTIPQDDGFLAALDDGPVEVTFNVRVQITEAGNSFTVAEKKVTVSKEGLSSVDLGTISLAYAVLSGTITASNGGKPIPRVYISAYNAQNNWIGDTYLDSPSANAPWSIYIPVQQGGAVTFNVTGSDSEGNWIFSKTLEPDAAKAVSNQPISGIALNIGDISKD